MEKRCSVCGLEKDVSCFSKHSGKSDVLKNQCKGCCSSSYKLYSATPFGKAILAWHLLKWASGQ